MSERLEQSDSNSMDQNIQIQANAQGENQIYIPYWEQQGSSSTQLNHLMEQIRILKNKCKHLENHLEENHREFSSLNQLYLISETNQKKVMKENEQLRKRFLSLNNELNHKKNQIEMLANEVENCSQRENDIKERMRKMKEKELELMGKVETLENQVEILKRKGTVSPKGVGIGEEDKWKKFYNEQVVLVEDKWKQAYEQLERDLDKKSKQFRQKAQQLKLLNKTHINFKEQSQQSTRSLQNQIDELRKQNTKSKSVISDLQRQLKDLREVLEDVSIKNDDIQRQNGKLKIKLADQVNRYAKLNKSLEEIQDDYNEAKRFLENKDKEVFTLSNQLNEAKMRESLLQRASSESKIEIQKLSMNSSYLESLILNLREELENLKRKKDLEVQQAIDTCEQRIKDLKKIQQQDRNKLNNKIKELEIQADELRQKVKLLKGQLQRAGAASQQNQDLLAIRDQAFRFKQEVASWKSKLEIANRKIKDLEDQSFSAKDCGHNDDIVKYKAQVLKLTASNSQLSRKLGEQHDQVEQINIRLLQQTNRVQQLIQDLDKLNREKKKLLQDNQHLLREKSKLLNEIQMLNEDLERQKQRDIDIAAKTGHIDERYLRIQRQLSEKASALHQLEIRMMDLRSQNETLKERRVQESKQERDVQKDKLKKIQAKITEKNRLIQQLQEKTDQLESTIQEKDEKTRALEKQLRMKQGEISKRDRKMKQLQLQLQNYRLQEQQNQQKCDKHRSELQLLKRQIKSQQNLVQKLKQQLINKSHDEKQNTSKLNLARQNQKTANQWQQKLKKFVTQLSSKQQIITQLRHQIKNAKPIVSDQVLTNQGAVNDLKAKTRDLQGQIILKNQKISELQQELRTRGKSRDKYRQQQEQSLSGLLQLEAQYAKELAALKRLILYKGQKEQDTKKYELLKNDYQSKIQLFLNDYKSMQEQMLTLKEQVLAKPIGLQMMPPVVDVFAIEEAWRMRLEELCRERQVLIDKVDLWERRFEELKYLYEAKLQSKEETINLLSLKISNIQLSYQGVSRYCYQK